MNKNLNNQNDKGAQRGQLQNQENRPNNTQPSGGGTNLNRDRDPNRVESWSNQAKDREKGIHPVEPSQERKLSSDRVTQPMGKGPELNREDGMGSSAGKSMNREKEATVVESGPIKNTSTHDGSPSPRTQAMYDREPVSKSSTFQSRMQNQESKLVEELKAPAITGTALYVIAALLLIAWAVGFFYFNAGAAIHVLLILALVSVLIKVVQGRSY